MKTVHCNQPQLTDDKDIYGNVSTSNLFCWVNDGLSNRITLRIESNIEQNDVLFAVPTVPLQTFVNI